MTLLATRGLGSAAVIATALVLPLGLAGCASDSASAPESSVAAVPTRTATIDPAQAKAAADEQAVKDVTDKYWAAEISSQSIPSDDPDQFAGVATGSHIEQTLHVASKYMEQGIRRVGEPVIGPATVTLDGDSATAEMCVNQDSWGAEQNGEPLPSPTAGPMLIALTATKSDGQWLITDRTLVDGADVSC